MKNNKGSVARITNEVFLQAVMAVGAEVKEIRGVIVTKAHAERTKEELMTEIRMISRAVDRDAETIVDHERRIGRLEKRFA